MGTVSQEDAKNKPKRSGFRKTLHKMGQQKVLLLMSVPFIIWLFVFCYVPLMGWVMAFFKVKPATFSLPLNEWEFVGFDNFKKAFNDRMFLPTLRNTLAVSLLGLVFQTIFSVGLAVIIHEIRFNKLKKFTQTISYLPHFVSWVIIASIAKNFLNDGGVLDTMFNNELHLMSENSPRIWFVITFINIWKECGWDTIIYLSAMAGIDRGLYEAAMIDGANRFQRIRYITLPGILPTLSVILIMAVGGTLNVSMERQMLLSNPLIQDHTMVISWFSYLRGIGNNNYGLGTAIGIAQSLVSVILLTLANWSVKRMGQEGVI
ncbi:ABC transporter permease [Fastidiosipila sanguinis]|nr:ABC transporter permease subunit [Fastidiosipila sanguinis]